MELLSRPGNSLNRSFPDIVDAVFGIPEPTVDKPTGQSDFEHLGRRARMSIASRVRAAALARPARLYVFDALAIGNRDLRGLPLLERKALLRESFDNTDVLVYVNGIADAGEWVFEQVVLHDFEGMVAKRESLYQGGRSHDWQKVKFADYSRQAALGFGRRKTHVID